MPEFEEIIEEAPKEPKLEEAPKESKIEEAPKEPKKVKKKSRIIKPQSPEPIETVTLRSHKREAPPKDEMVISYNSVVRKIELQYSFLKKVQMINYNVL